MNVNICRRDFLQSTGIAAAWLALPRCAHGFQREAQRPAAPHPNIVYILADDMGYGDLTCQNRESKIPTPNMDRLAAEGVRFRDAHSSSAVCTPTRYGILTGRYCWRTRLKRGVLWGYSPPLIEPERLTVAGLLKRHGYRTACIGKWHLGLGWVTADAKQADKKGTNVDFKQAVKGGPLELGFDYFHGISASLDMPPYVYIENARAVAIPTETTRAGGRKGLTAPGFKAVEVMPRLTGKAVEWIERQALNKPRAPFFLYFPLTAPHTPVVPTDWVKGRSRAGDYGDFVALVDWAVGEVMKTLEKHQLDNTLIIVTSDNGSTRTAQKMMKQYGHRPNYLLRGRKSDVWDGGHRIPFIARWKGRAKPGATCDQTVCLTDLLATCAEIMGERLPDNAGQDSFSILPALLGRKTKGPLRQATVHHSVEGMFAIRQGPWKLVLGRGSGGWSTRGVKFKAGDPEGQLYNMEEDLSETTNLYERRPEVVKRLTLLLERYKKEGRSRPFSTNRRKDNG